MSVSRPVLLALLLSVVACKSDPKVDAKHRQDIDRVVERLSKLSSAVPDPQTLNEDLVCNDSEIEKNYKAGEAELTLTAFDFDYLRRLSTKAAAAGDPWSFLNSPSVEEQLSKSRDAKGSDLANAAEALRRVEQRRYVVVFRAAQRELPKVDGDKFDGGMYDGHLIVMDLESTKTVCHALLEVESSDVVEFEELTPGKNGERALAEDFQKQFQKVGSKALRSISKRIHVPLTGINLE